MTLSMPYNSIILQDVSDIKNDEDALAKVEEIKGSSEPIRYKVINNGDSKPKKGEDCKITS